jgi:hypothetical protein
LSGNDFSGSLGLAQAGPVMIISAAYSPTQPNLPRDGITPLLDCANLAKSWPETNRGGWINRQCLFVGSIDDLAGAGKDRWREGQSKFVSNLEIYDQLEGGRLLGRQVGARG